MGDSPKPEHLRARTGRKGNDPMFKKTAYINASVYTMEKEGDKCSAFVVEDGKFVYCGTDEEARALADEVVDLGGKTVLPGLIDTHQHLYSSASNLVKLTLDKVRSMKELKEVVREYAKTVPAGEWIYGFGFDNEFFTDTKEMPTKFDLDEACANHPVLLSRSCMHFFSANSLALKMAGIDRNFKPEVEGNVVFGADGEPTGVVCDAAGAKIAGLIPDKLATLEAKKDVLEQAIRELNTHGLTGVHPIQGRHVELMEYMDAYQELNDEGRLTARIYLGYDELPNCCIRTGLGDEMVKYGFYKLFVDGNLGGRTAALLEPYSDDPDTVGHCNYTQDEFTALVQSGLSAQHSGRHPCHRRPRGRHADDRHRNGLQRRPQARPALPHDPHDRAERGHHQAHQQAARYHRHAAAVHPHGYAVDV